MHDAAPTPPIPAPAGWRLFESTLGSVVTLTGAGLHTGRKVTAHLFPRSGQGEERGILFRRTGSATGAVTVNFRKKFWLIQPLCSTLRAPDGTLYRTVEHLLASLLFCEIDHAVVELDEEEVPILDGSANEWLAAIQAAGRVSLPCPKRFIRITGDCEYRFGERSSYFVEPCDAYRVSMTVQERGFAVQQWSGDLTPAEFAREVAPSRSYGSVKFGLACMAAGYLLGKPLLRGARLSSVAAIVNKRIVGGARFPDEFVRHRVLDICGDFACSGGPLLGHFRISQPTHRRNLRFIRYIIRQRPDIWEWVTFPPSAGETAKPNQKSFHTSV